MSHDRPDRHAGHGSKQLTAAGIACGISLCLHLVAALFVARVVIVPTRQGRQQEAPKRRYEAVDISDLSVAEAVRDKVLDELRASGAVAVTDLPEQIERLAPAPDETALTPPELADASVLGSEAAIAEPSALPARAAWQALQALARLLWVSRSPTPWVVSSFGPPWAASGTRPRSGATAGPISGPCPAGSFRA